MSNIKISRERFEKDIGKIDEKMQEKIALFGTPLESLNEKEIELEIFPNRPDLLSYPGFKRAFLGFLGKKTGLIEYKLNRPEKEYVVKVDSSVKDVRPLTACAVVKNLELDDEKIKEVIDMQEKLHLTVGRKRKKLAFGIYPMEKIKFPITYEALEPDKIRFVPLEFDKELSGLEILQRHPTGRDYAHLLKGKSKFPIFKDSEGKILSMPPIINSELTGKITKETRNVFIECSGFDEKILEKCLNIIVTNLIDIGGKPYQIEIKSKINKLTPNFKTEKMKISMEKVNALLGLNLKENDLKECLEKMGYNYSRGEVEIPSWRADILHEIDLIEDAAIAYGYEKFEPEIPSISTFGKESQNEIIKRKISEILTGAGLIETSNYHLTIKEDQFTKMGIPEKQEQGHISLIDSKTEYNILRKNLSSCLLKTFTKNIDNEYPQKIFEIGKVFEENFRGEIEEKEFLAIGISPGNFTDTKQILEYLSKMLNSKLETKEQEKENNYLIEGRTGGIFLEKNLIGEIGEVHPKILKNWKIKMPVSLLEIDLKEIFKKFN